MSGIEIAGLVLGALPLVVSALEHYAEGVSTIKKLCNYPSEFRNLSRRLRVEQDIFRNTMELLLHDCVDDELLTDLLDHPEGKAWSDPTVETLLQRKLQKSFRGYLETAKGMSKTLAEFKQRLKLDEHGKVPFDDPKSFREAYKRFRFGLLKTQYMDLVQKISKDNTALSKLTEQCLALEPARTSRRRLPNFDKIRAHACSMFTMLQNGLRGSCKASHRASLYMKRTEDGRGLIKDPVSGSANDITFRVILHHEIPMQHRLSPQWLIQEAEFRLLDTPAITQGQVQSQKLPTGKQSKGKRAIRFQDPQTPALAAQTVTVQQQQDLEEIIDLCASIQRLRSFKHGVCLGYMLDMQTERRHGLYWPNKRLVDKASLDTTSLGEILTQQGKQQDLKLSIADSRRLAPALALATLQLYDTPWLGRHLTRYSVLMFRQGGKVLAEHPFVSTDLHAGCPVATSAQGKSLGFAGVGNETLFALGVVLIELCFGQPFDGLQAPEDLNADGTKHVASDLLTATRLVAEVYDRAGGRYGDAVRRCIRCEFDQRKTSLDNEAFRIAVYDNVVAVLEEDVKQFFNL